MKIYEKRVTIRLFILSTVAGSCIGAYCESNDRPSRCCNNFQMINGKCEACQAGYFGVECSSICPYGFYGIACKQTCLCAYGSICLPDTGCDCNSPPVIKNGNALFTSTYPGSKAFYNCNEGYIGSWMNSISCLENGTWENTSSTCRRIDCGLPPVVENTRSLYKSTLYGSSAVYICNKGYVLSGNDTIKCLRNASWEQQLFECRLKENSTNGNMLYFVGVTVVVFTVIIVSMVMIFRNRFKSYAKRYKGVAYISNASKRVENLMYTDLHEYYEIGNIPDQSPVTLVSVPTSNLEITPSNV